MRCLTIAFTTALLLAGCAPAEEPSVAAPTDDNEIRSLIELLEGSYRGPDATVMNPGPEDTMTDTRIVMNVPALGEHVVYWQIKSGPKQREYRKLLMVFERDGEAIVQTQLRPGEGSEWPEEITADSMAAMAAEDFVPVLPDGCDTIWRAVEGGYAGYLDPETCSVYSERNRMSRKIEAETIVTAEGLRQTERGFTESGEMMFGTPPNEYHVLPRL